MIDRDKLRDFARAALAGHSADGNFGDCPQCRFSSAFEPAAALALLDRLEAAEKERDEAYAALTELLAASEGAAFSKWAKAKRLIAARDAAVAIRALKGK